MQSERKLMRAVVLTRFGPPEVLRVRDVPKPIPKEHEVLVRVVAATVSAADSELRGRKLPFPFRLLFRAYAGFHGGALIPGQEVAGDVERVGSAVTRFREGDAVFGWTGFGLGGYAEYVCVREYGVLSAKPPGVSYVEAAALVVGGLEATYFLRKAHLERSDRVLIVGAGGSIGTFAVQIAKSFGTHVTAVDREGKLPMLRSLGADRVLDYAREDFTESEDTYDVIFDVPGKVSLSRGMKRLAPNGRYLLANPPVSRMIFGGRGPGPRGTRIIAWQSRTQADYTHDLGFLNELVESRTVRSVIDRTFPLEHAADAHRYVDTGEKKGSVVLLVNPSVSPYSGARPRDLAPGGEFGSQRSPPTGPP